MADSFVKDAFLMPQNLVGLGISVVGAAMLPFLNRGKEGIKELTDLSAQLGLTWGERDVQAAEQFARTIEILELRGTAFKENFAKGVLPALNQVADAFTRGNSMGGSFAKARSRSTRC